VFDSHSLPPTKICVSALTDAAVYVTLARIHDGNGQYNLALQEIRQALKLEPHTGGATLLSIAILHLLFFQRSIRIGENV